MNKECTKCKRVYPSTTEYFYKDKNYKDNLSPWCKECKKEYQNKYNGEHKEEKKKYNKEYYPENKEKFIPIHRDPIQFKEYQKRYRMSEQGKKIFRKHFKYRYMHKKHDIWLKEWDACRLYFNYRCAYCNKTYEQQYEEHKKDFSKDHYHNNGSNDILNCVPACTNCNCSKHTAEAELWYNDSKEFYNVNNLHRINKWLNEESIAVRKRYRT